MNLDHSVTKGRLVLLLLPAFIVMAVAILLYANQQARVNHFAAELRNGLVASCENNGNPLRKAVADQIQTQINQSEGFLESGQYQRFFPNIPPAELKRLITAQNKRLRVELGQIEPVDCAALYPRP